MGCWSELPARRGDITDARELLAERVGDRLASFSYDTTTAIDAEAAAHARAIWSEVAAAHAVNSGDHDVYVKLLYLL